MRILTIIFICILTLPNTQLQAQTTGSRYGNTLNLGIGIGGYGGYYGYSGSYIPVLHANYELDVAKNFTLAPFISFHSQSRAYNWKNNRYYYRQTVVPIGVKGMYYFDDMVKAASKWDFYLGGSLGFAIISSRWDDGYDGDKNYFRNPQSLFLNFHLGAEYRFSQRIGAFVDFSTGVSTFGIAIH
jgi:hypothetical protein